MAMELIGTEALPNLYIKFIEISEKSLDITVAFYEYINDDGSRTVYGDYFLNKNNININVLLCKENSDVDAVLNATSNYSMFKIKKNMINFNKNTGDFTSDPQDVERIIEKPINSFSIKSKINENIIQGKAGEYVEITEVFTFTFPDPIVFLSKLRCYSFFSFDIWKEPNHSLLDVSAPYDSKLLHGPIFSEHIIHSDDVKTTTSAFSIEDQPYSGPVHFHDGKYMEGSLHSDTPHRNVDFTIVPNRKISLINPHSSYNKKENTPVSHSKVFSRPMIAVGNGFIYGYFTLDIDKFMQQQSANYYLNSKIYIFNSYKILDYVKVKLNNTQIEVAELPINNSQANQATFYFYKEFENFTASEINLKFSILSLNNLYRNYLDKQHTIHSAHYNSLRSIYYSQSGENVFISSPVIINNFLKTYMHFVTIYHDVTDSEMSEILNFAKLSLYRSQVPRTTISKYLSYVSDKLSLLKDFEDSLVAAAPSARVENKTTEIALESYENSISYVNSMFLDPGRLEELIGETNSNLTNISGLLPNEPQFLAPLRFRESSGNLLRIKYNNLEAMVAKLKVQVSGDGTLEELIPEEHLPNNPNIVEENTSDPAQQEDTQDELEKTDAMHVPNEIEEMPI